MTRDECITAVAEVLAGLQVPVSMGIPLGAALEPWRTLHEEAKAFGWATADDYAEMLQATL